MNRQDPRPPGRACRLRRQYVSLRVNDRQGRACRRGHRWSSKTRHWDEGTRQHSQCRYPAVLSAGCLVRTEHNPAHSSCTFAIGCRFTFVLHSKHNTSKRTSMGLLNVPAGQAIRRVSKTSWPRGSVSEPRWPPAIAVLSSFSRSTTVLSVPIVAAEAILNVTSSTATWTP